MNMLRERRGVTNVELVVSAAVVLTVLTIVTSLCYQINRVWIDVRHHRVAMVELSSQMDRLTRLDADKVALELENLQVSEYALRTLPEATLDGAAVDSELGMQITLKLTWPNHRGLPIELTGWSAARGNGEDGS